MRTIVILSLVLFIGTTSCQFGGGAQPQKDLIIESAKLGEINDKYKDITGYYLIPLDLTIKNLQPKSNPPKIPKDPIKFNISGVLYNISTSEPKVIGPVDFLYKTEVMNPQASGSDGMMVKWRIPQEGTKEISALCLAASLGTLPPNSILKTDLKIRIDLEVDSKNVVKEKNENNNKYSVSTVYNK